MKIALVAITAGVVERGVETLAWNFKKRIPFETKVFSIADSSWTTAVPYRKFEFWHEFIKFSKSIGFYRLLYQLEKVNHYFDFFAEASLDTWTFSQNLMRELQEFRPQIVVNMAGSTVGYFLRKFRCQTGTKFINISVGGKCLSEIKNARTDPDTFTVPTPSAKQYFESKNLKVRLEMIPWGGDSDLLANGEKFSLKEIEMMSKTRSVLMEHPFVLSTSALEKQKKIDYLIKAMHRFGKGSLIVAGDGSCREEWVRLGRNLLGERFIYLGVIPKEQIHKLYNSCDLFCLPNVDEYFGCVFVEALLAGLPIVANDDEDKRYILGKNAGVLTKVSDIDRIASAIEMVSTRNWGEGPRKQGEHFSWAKIMKQYENLIIELVHSK